VSPEICRLCGATGRPIEPEHSIPLWLSTFLRSRAGPLGFSWVENGQVIIADRFNWKTPVCGPCNAWMNDKIETPAQGLIERLMVADRTLDRLTRARQFYSASWIFKTAMMLDACDTFHGNARRCPSDEVGYFFRHGVPSAFTSVWIGQSAENFMGSDPPKNMILREGILAQIVLKRVWAPWLTLFQLSTLAIHQPPDTYEPVQLPVEAQRFMVRIWPPHDDVIEWPPKPMDRSTFESVRRMVVSMTP
jgi:hypothetical protein